MSHALIIELNMVVGNALSKRLSDLGFDSFDHVWTEDDAVAIAEMRPPVPVLMVTADSVRAKQRLMDGAVIDGPFAFSKFPEAIEAAKGQPQRLATYWRSCRQ